MTASRVVAMVDWGATGSGPKGPEADVGTWARPYVWRDPASIPPRAWLYGGFLLRRFVSATFAPGGLGKSALALAEAVALASGRDILGQPVTGGRCRVWYWNGEDPLEETERRLGAILKHHGFSREDVEGWLFIGSGRDADLIIGEQTREGTEIQIPVVTAIERLLLGLRIDVVIIDPFVSSHRVPENDNGAVDAVSKTWSRIAERCNAAIHLCHHTRKRANANDETTVEDGRGAVALIATVRSARVLNAMTAQEAEKAGVDNPRAYFRCDIGKQNLAPAADASTWYRFESVSLCNGSSVLDPGDSVGVVTPWGWPRHLEGVSVEHLAAVQRAIEDGTGWRENAQAARWAGHAVAQAMGLDLSNKATKAKVKGLLKTWMATGALVAVVGHDAKGMERTFLEVGNWASTAIEESRQ